MLTVEQTVGERYSSFKLNKGQDYEQTTDKKRHDL